jgi:hypothetical protein
MATLQHIAFTSVQTIAYMVWLIVVVMNMCSRGLSEQQRQSTLIAVRITRG